MNTITLTREEIPNNLTKDQILEACKMLFVPGAVKICSECGSEDLDIDEPPYVICHSCELCTDIVHYKLKD